MQFRSCGKHIDNNNNNKKKKVYLRQMIFTYTQMSIVEYLILLPVLSINVSRIF